jgi:hypothetical protein
MMWSFGLIYGCSSTPDTPAETFAEHVVIRVAATASACT